MVKLARRGVAMEKRAMWNEARALSMLAALAASGKTAVQFARENGFHPSKVNWWRNELARRAAKASSVTMVPVTVRDSGDGVAQATSEVVLTSGVIVRVGPQFDDATLVRLIRAANEATRC